MVRANTIQAIISGSQRVFIVDTGSGISLIQTGGNSCEVSYTNLSSFCVTGKELEMQGTQEETFYFNGWKFRHQFCVCSLPTGADGIIGTNYLCERNAHLHLEKSQFRLLKGFNFKHGFVGYRKREARANGTLSLLHKMFVIFAKNPS
jgi:hypothetical protein